MYLGGGKVGEFDMAGAPWSQAIVDDRWREIGAPPPAPLVPKSMIGWYAQATRGPPMLTLSRTGKLRKSSARHMTKEERDFLNYFGKIAIDPFRHQSGISKVAGGILQVVGVAIPAFGYFQAVEAAGNAALDAKKQQSDANLTTRVMQPAIDVELAKERAVADSQAKAADEALARQLQVLKSASTSLVPITSNLGPSRLTASTSIIPAQRPVEKKYFGLTQKQLLIGVGLLGLIAIGSRA